MKITYQTHPTHDRVFIGSREFKDEKKRFRSSFEEIKVKKKVMRQDQSIAA